MTLEEASACTRAQTFGHYENFPVASWLIPKRLRQHVCNIYAFARTADDFADEPQFAGQRMERLQEWRGFLHQCALGALHHERSEAPPRHCEEVRSTDEAISLTPLPPVFIALRETIREFQLPVSLLNDLLTAFMLDVTKPRYATFHEVLHYCRHSANPVGRLILHLFGYGNEHWMTLSDAICTALQLANFWQDVAIDLQKNDGNGRIYIPQEDLARYGVSNDDFFARQPTQAVRELMAFQVERTEQMFQRGRALCDLVPHPRLRWQLRLTWLGGMRILHKIRRNHYDVFQRPTLTPIDWATLLLRAWRWQR